MKSPDTYTDTPDLSTEKMTDIKFACDRAEARLNYLNAMIANKECSECGLSPAEEAAAKQIDQLQKVVEDTRAWIDRIEQGKASAQAPEEFEGHMKSLEGLFLGTRELKATLLPVQHISPLETASPESIEHRQAKGLEQQPAAA